jgi:acetoin utilization deacetylase AcuC-like enzyme
VSELLLVRQRRGHHDRAPWIVDGGRRVRGHDHNERLAEIEAGLRRHPGVRGVVADADDADVERVLAQIHEPGYLRALQSVGTTEPVVMAELAPPGMEVDIPVAAGLVAAAGEGARTALSAARHLAAGAHLSYALCRPPGHHAGPGWLAGYCYLNTAAAAVQTLREAGVGPVGVLDLDLHYPNGTAAIVQRMPDVWLHSLHAWPVTNVPGRTACAHTPRERLVEIRGAPREEEYLTAVAASLAELARSVVVLVLSIGYDTVRGDPHGSWSLPPTVFEGIGRLLAATGLPVCVVQEGGYDLGTLGECGHAFAGGLLSDGAARDRAPRRVTPDRSSSRVSADRLRGHVGTGAEAFAGEWAA